ncbi:MAG TPA: hypothetical protein VEV15_13555 [Flavisolibacter sp.]|nr:hypothetical protein [Flavisolibacter sp.]
MTNEKETQAVNVPQDSSTETATVTEQATAEETAALTGTAETDAAGE